MSSQDNEEFKNAIKDLAFYAPLMENAFDRVRCSEWTRKLASMSGDDFESAKTRNEYMQYLRIMVRSGQLFFIFKNPPPDGQLAPFPECVGNEMAKKIPFLPAMGPVQPLIVHQSPDGCAYISTKQVPGGGMFCYMAVTPDGIE
ncbi:uncharacterized protein LOC134537701 [Bacillus rossius redtenbacheri]|uniref:uncharacterized protein LOC134537701 n=1 Tax=Bacillus rossius redtenbacheri TaxID=93214 RepID=UPI002FDD04C6